MTAPSAPLVAPPPKFHISMEAPVGEQARLKRSRTEAGQERCPTSGGETLPPDIQHPDVTSTPTLPQFLSSMPGSKRKRTPRPTSMPEDERAEQVFADHEAEEDVGDRRGNEDLSAGLDGQMGDGWSEQGYGCEDSDEFDRLHC